ncbi:MAG: MauE/DoxX family redox-associated membrane protein [Anaerolineales bacterium]
MRLAANLSAMVISAVLLFSGIVHAAQPYYFIHTVSSYRLLPASVSGVLGLWLPYLQIVLAIYIGLGIAEKVALWIAASVFMAYTIAQLSVLARGMEIDCGCFGFVSTTVSVTSVAIPLLLIGVCILALAGVKSPSPSDSLTPQVA